MPPSLTEAEVRCAQGIYSPETTTTSPDSQGRGVTPRNTPGEGSSRPESEAGEDTCYGERRAIMAWPACESPELGLGQLPEE